ncbi:MAG: hypothetical protein HY868_02615 [Chloroflexi bacterium]|nr:hypothetical protein [Chloroflexota bacterium]
METVGNSRFIALAISDLGQTNAPGKPQLPIKGTLVGIPAGADVALRLVGDETRNDVLAHPSLPAPTTQVQFDPTQTLPRYLGRAFIPDSSAYSTSQVYPASTVRLVSFGTWRSQRYALIEFAPLQYNAASRQLIFHRRLRVELTFTYPGGARSSMLGQPINEGFFEPMLARSIVNYSSAKNWRSRAKPTQAVRPPRATQVNAAGPWYKIAVSDDGIYQITCAQFANAGINLTTLDPRTLKIFKQGNEIAIQVLGQDDGHCDGGDVVLFYGQAARTKYTNTNIYWFTFGGAAGKRMTQRDGSGTGTLVTTFTASVHLEKDWQYIPYLPRAEDSDHWYWLSAPNPYDPDHNGDPTSVDYAFALPNLASGLFTATLQIRIAGFSASDHQTLTYINGHLLDDTTWNGNVERVAAFNFPQNYLDAITNTIRIKESLPSPNRIDINHYDVGYAGTLTAIGDTRRFGQTATGAWQYQVNGFTLPTIQGFDITNPFDVAQITNATVSSAGLNYTFQFADTLTAPRTYLALTTAQFKSPASIALDSPSDLRNASNGADYIIIAYGDFIPNIQPLATFRTAQGMRVKIVDVQDVYDEFSDGLMDAQAIHDFLQWAYTNWQSPAPAYVLLVGDGNFDFKNNYGFGEPNFIPPYLRFVDPWAGETASDNRLVAFNATNALPSMAIGRLPADSAADVATMVNKILGYEQNAPGGAWRSTITFVSDNAYQTNGTLDNAGNFWNLSDQIAGNSNYVPSTLTVDRIYFNPCNSQTYPQCALAYSAYPTNTATKNGILAAINDGRLIVNYLGHSAIQFWAGEQLFGVADLPALTNQNKLPVFLAMTCYDGYFHFPGVPSLAEKNVRLAGGGALASWSASGLGVASGHDYLNRGFFQAVFRDRIREIGPAAIAGKMYLWVNSGGANHDLLDTFTLLGDPASRLYLPAPNIYLPMIVR